MKEKNSRVRKTIINTVTSFISQITNGILSFLMRTVFIYSLGIQYTGVSSVFTDILTMLSLSELGIGTAIATALYEPLKYNDKDKIQKLMKFYRIAYRFIAAITMCIGIALLPFLKYLITDVPDISENISIIFILYIIKTSTSYLMIYKTTLLNADQKQYIIKMLETICIVVRYIIEIICLLVFKQYMIYLVIEIIAIIIQNYIVTQRAHKEYPYAFKKTTKNLEKKEIKSLFRDIKGLSMYQISSSIGNSIDNIMVSSFISTTVVGMLSNYTLIRKQIENIVKQFFSAVIPSIGNLAAEKDIEKQYIIFNRILYLSFIMVNFCSVSLFVIFNPFIKLWLGKEYLLNINIPFIIALDFFLYIILQAIASFRTANGLFVKGQYRPLVTTGMNIILTIIFIKKLGVFGAILATVLCRIFTQWYDPFILFKYIFKKPFKYFYLKYWCYIILYLSGSLITFNIANLFLWENTFFDVLIKCLICIIIPNIWALIFTFKTDEFKYFKELIESKLKKTSKLNKVI